MAQGELVRIVLVLGGVLVAVVLIFVLVSRMLRSAQARLGTALRSLIADGEGGPYRGATSRLERATVETGPDGPRLRFAFRDQRALLDFAAPTTNAGRTLAPRRFGGFAETADARTELRFWIRPAREARIDPDDVSIDGPWQPDARRHIENLRSLGHQRGVGIAATSEGLFIVKRGWLGISLDAAALRPFLDEACALVALHVDGRLFEVDDVRTRA
jgi:hypothetical protein